MKIAFILPVAFQTPSKGCRVVYEYADRLAGRGHEITIYYPLIELNAEGEFAVKQKTIAFCLRNTFPIEIRPAWFRFSNRVRHLLIPEANDLYIENGDCLIASTWAAAYMLNEVKSPLKGKKYYLIQGEEVILEPEYRQKIGKTYFMEYKNIVVSQWLYDYLRKKGAAVDAYIPNGIDSTLFHIKNPIGQRQKGIVMFCHSSPWRGTKDGLQAIEFARERHTDLKISLCGAHARPKNLPEYIEYVQAPARERLCDIFNAHALYVSTDYADGFDSLSAEAMACGCAVVTTHMGVSDYAIHQKTALISSPGDVKSLAKNILSCLEDDRLRQTIAGRGSKEMQNFCWDRSVEQLEGLFVRELWSRIV